MSIKVITARQMIDRFVFVIHLDTTKADELGQPLERWLLRREWPLKLTAQKTGYLAAIRAELITASREMLARLVDEDSGGVALPIEGGTLPPLGQ